MALPTYSAAQAAYQLTNGYWGGRSYSWSLDASRTVTYSFASTMTATERQLAEEALETWSNVANIKFSLVNSGQIRFTNAASGAYASLSSWGGNLSSVTVNISSAWTASYGSSIGGYAFQTYVHEIGHALGLGHTGNYNGSASFARDALYANDSWQTSVMSYFSQNENTYVTASYAYLLTPMAFDIAALRSLYGAAPQAHAGNTIYGAGSTAGDALDYLGRAGINTAVAFTLVDSSGVDLIDFSALAGANRISLAPGAVSNAFGKTGNMAIASDTVIENLRTGAGADTLTGNDAANAISSGAGNDSIDGAAGNDTLTGGAGNDTLTGGAGADTFVFGTGFGFDRITDFTATDFIDISALAGMTAWSDVAALMSQSAQGVTIATLQGTILLAGVSLAAISASSFVLGSGTGGSSGGGGDTPGGQVIVGAAGVDTLTGGAGNDSIDGGAGNDSIVAGLGDDSVLGGAGNDRIRLDGGNDRFVDSTDAGADQVWGGAGNDILTSLGGRDSLYGDEGADVLTASALGSVMAGGTGDDTILGGSGADIVTDTGGNDRVSLGAGNDRYTASGDSALLGDSVAGGDGIDTITGGAGNDTITGDGGSDVLSGGGGADVILGGDGADRITAGDGNDTVTGGAGSDRIDLGAGDDRVVDAADGTSDTVLGGAGNDVLVSLGGRDQMDGGAGDDLVQASNAGSVLEGGTGNDTLTGGAGADSVSDSGGRDLVSLGAGNDTYSASGDRATDSDTVWGGDGADRISCSAGNDLILGGSGNDTLLGGAGNDRILGGSGSDLLTGGTGYDVFVFAAGDGADRITDFRIGQDRIDLTALDGLASWADLRGHLTQSGRAVIASFDGVSLTLDNTTLSALTANDFLF